MFKYFQFSQDNEGKKDTLLAGWLSLLGIRFGPKLN
jgi:hypothetical protein